MRRNAAYPSFHYAYCAVVPGRSPRIPVDIAMLLRRELPSVDFGSIRLVDGIPWRAKTLITPAAVTYFNTIHLDQSINTRTRYGLELLAHEVAHIEQQSVWSNLVFGLEYGLDYAINVLSNGFDGDAAYRNEVFEIEARYRARHFMNGLAPSDFESAHLGP
jgi:hypothetical protein